MEIQFEGVSADYQLGPIRRKSILDTVNLHIQKGSFTAVLGHAGAGKTSLIKAMNGLLIPHTGKVKIDGITIEEDTRQLICKKVGMVFQFPESQLFAETVEKDICFGPLNFGVALQEAKTIAKKVIQQVGLSENILGNSPFSLSGGQKRRVAIAGILAMEPEVLVLDEPGAGLDQNGKKELFTLLTDLNQHHHITIVMVTHDMNDVIDYADNVVIMENGKVVKHCNVRNTFSNLELLDKWSLDLPDVLSLQMKIEKEIGRKLSMKCFTVEELSEAIIAADII